MYVPAHFRESRPEVLHDFMRRHPLAAVVVRTPQGLEANHVPLQLSVEAGIARLRGHVARANPVWRQALPEEPALAIFTGADAYVSPSWYPSKRVHGKVVPTWNYAAVHASGPVRFVEDAAWLRVLVGELTDAHESRRAEPWKVEDAPGDYVGEMLRAIVGLEIEVRELAGKFKASQNREARDREGVAAGFAADGVPGPAAGELVR
ncbi:MAG: FMN-binding negative transcriptional regulator [Steroidobacteraceae bacterium]|jgi:transcriptional regulator|nr:FMN-binding negative transcriptional regulator [Steroidobacteraceae bacterium]